MNHFSHIVRVSVCEGRPGTIMRRAVWARAFECSTGALCGILLCSWKASLRMGNRHVSAEEEHHLKVVQLEKQWSSMFDLVQEVFSSESLGKKFKGPTHHAMYEGERERERDKTKKKKAAL